MTGWWSGCEPQIDARERRARAVKPLGYVVDMGGNRIDDMFSHSRVRHRAEDGARYVDSDRAAQEHFSAHDPDSTLAEVAAHRAILAAYGTARAAVAGGIEAATAAQVARLDAYEYVVRHLSTVYAGREGWRQEWGLR